MATYSFSALADGAEIAFDAAQDDLLFDQASISAADLRVTTEEGDVRIAVAGGPQAGKSVLLLGVSELQLATSNVQFANASQLLFGDNSTATNDDAANVLGGTSGDDLIQGFGGNDRINAGNGNDRVLGGAGNDFASGNAGMDWVQGGAGNDTIAGGGAQDSFAFSEAGSANADLVSDFASGWDSLHFDAGNFTSLGPVGQLSSGDGRFHAAAGATSGHDADDRLVYDTSTGRLFYDADGSGSGAAQLIATLQNAPNLVASDLHVFGVAGGGDPGDGGIRGTEGDDSLVGTAGDDSIEGLGGNDTLDGGAGNDTLNGGLGNDTYVDSLGIDVIVDAGGIDTLIATGGTLPDSIENLTIRTGQFETGGAGNALDNLIRNEASEDTFAFINGGAGNDTLLGGAGGDFFTISQGDDSIDGGGGTNWIEGGSVDFSTGTATIGAGTTVFANITSAIGSGADDSLIADAFGRVMHGEAGNDTLAGGAGDDTLFGDGGFDHPDTGGGNDLIRGGGGDDSLIGGNGDDTMDGGTGNDQLVGLGDIGAVGAHDFLFTVAPGAGNADVVVGFASGEDEIVMSADAMTALGAGGQFTAGDARFRAGSDVNSGQDASDRVVYNTTTGQLWYDADGSGVAAALLIATLDGAPTLLATDIEVIGATEPPPDGIVGTEGNDSLTGTGGNDTIHGLGGNDSIQAQAGNDTVFGGAGNDVFSGNAGMDWVQGGTGNDTVTGGGAQDSFAFSEYGSANADQLIDFASGWDSLHFDAAIFSALGEGQFSAGDGRFRSGAGLDAPQDADDRLIYNTSTGQLWYHAGGFTSAQLVATLHPGATLVGTDIQVFRTEGDPDPGPGEVNGTPGEDTLIGTTGDDTINGLAGNDELQGLEGNDLLRGGDGNDVLWGSDPSTPPWRPGDGWDTLEGGLGNDHYHVRGEVLARDVIVEDVGGIDTVHAHDTDWTLGAGLDNLVLHDSAGAAYSLTGNELDNVIEGPNAERLWLFGMGGEDTLHGTFFGANDLYGGEGNDLLLGNARGDLLSGGAGNDTLEGAENGDVFLFDVAPGAANADVVLDFGNGDDRLRFDGNAYAGIGFDGDFSEVDERFVAGAGLSAGQDASDRIVYDTTTGRLWYDADGSGSGEARLVATLQPGATLVATDIHVINGSGEPGGEIDGTPGDDTLVGTEGNDTINGLAGNDSLRGIEGTDYLDGGEGNDTLDGGNPERELGGTDPDVETMDGGLGDDLYVVDNAADVLMDAGGEDTVLAINVGWSLAAGFEDLTLNNGGAESPVTGIGNELDNVLDARVGWQVGLFGMAGDDTLFGSARDDTLAGGTGQDALNAGGTDEMQDVFVFDVAPGAGNADVVEGFEVGVDRFWFDADAYANIGAGGDLAAGDARFVAGAGLNAGQDGSDRFVYNTTTGQLWYDADGGGAGAAQLVATLEGAPELAATDIRVLAGTPPSPGGIVGTEGNDVLTGTGGDDTISGLGGHDAIQAQAGNDTVFGGAGNDVFSGNAGADWLDGGAGNDTITGGGGQDQFVFSELGAANADVVVEFAPGWDRFNFDGDAFAALGPDGAFAANDERFHAAAGAAGGGDLDDRIVYDTTSGALYYDADGSGSGEAELVATLQNGAALTAADISVI